jgi:hypothetical protein
LISLIIVLPYNNKEIWNINKSLFLNIILTV